MLEVDKPRFAPCHPADRETFKLHCRYRETVCHIIVVQTHAADNKTRVTVDGVEQPEESVPLVEYPLEHAVEARMYRAQG